MPTLNVKNQKELLAMIADMENLTDDEKLFITIIANRSYLYGVLDNSKTFDNTLNNEESSTTTTHSEYYANFFV